MSAEVAYLDTSAFVKLLVEEPESAALRSALEPWAAFASSLLLRTETLRALHRSGNAHLIGRARRLLGAVNLIAMDVPLADRAGELAPPQMRSLDAIHLASALSLGTELGVLVAYDERLVTAAVTQGIPVASPS